MSKLAKRWLWSAMFIGAGLSFAAVGVAWSNAMQLTVGLITFVVGIVTGVFVGAIERGLLRRD